MHENIVVLLPVFPSPWEIIRGEGKFHTILIEQWFLVTILNVLKTMSLKEFILKWLCFGYYANRTENSYSSGTEQKDLACVFSDCVLHKENYIRPGKCVFKRSRGLVCCSDLELFTVTFWSWSKKCSYAHTQRIGPARNTYLQLSY